MDKRLGERLNKLSKHLDALRVVEEVFLTLEANKKMLYSQLFLNSSGNNVAEREAKVYVTKDWQDFIKAHVEAETEFNFARRRLDLLLKAYDAEHLTLKTETPVIKRQL